MKNESGKANKEKQDGMHGKRYVRQKKYRENQKEKIRLCVAISLGVGTLLFSVWTFSGKEKDYTNENGYMAFEKAAGEGTSVGVLVSEKKAGQKSKKDAGNKAEKMAESAAEDELETESESESDTEPGMDSELETNDELRKTENKKETQSETQPEKESQTNTEKENDSVLESEIEKKFKREEESEGERKGERKESGANYGSEEESEQTEETEVISEESTEEEPYTEEEWESESRDEIESESMEESEENYESEEESEQTEETEVISEESTEEEPYAEEEWESESRDEIESESMEESEENYEREEESEQTEETETISEESTEKEPSTEEERERESEEKRKERPEGEKESEMDSGREQAKETEISKETEEEAEKETGTSPAVPEPLPVYRGKQYEIRGDENAWYRDETGRLWVRKGSNIYVDPIKQQGYTQGGSVTDAQQDGRLTFQLKKTDAKGNVIAISTLQQEAYFVDGEVPEARIEPSGNLESGMVYAAQSSAVAVTVPPDGKSGLKRVAYRIEKGDSGSEENGKWSDWVDCGENQLVNITGEGTYRVHVRTEDRVGNLAFSSSVPICVDCTPPQIEIKGVQGETANSGSVPIQVQCRDLFYRPGSLCVKIIGANNGKVPKIKASGEKKEFASTEFFDFPHEQIYDDAYRLEVKAEDLAGNITQKILDFSINRFGSVYDLSGETKKALQPYYLTEAADIVFLEMNIDYVGESEIYCRENGELKKLNRGEDYTVELQGSSDSWKQYRYTIPAAYFEKEGVYEILLSSKDRAENESDTGLQGKQVTFALDWTEPECLVTGVEPLGVYRGEYQVACIQPKDNLGVQVAKIYHDSELVQTVERENTPVKLKLDEQREWQTLQVYVRDLAGNEYWSPEIPVFVSGKTEEVLPYEKTRKSAQEKEEELILKRAGYGTSEDRKTADFAKGKKEGEEEREAGKESGKNAGVDKEKQQSGEESLLGKMERIRRGRLLLAFGTILFLVTFLVCILPVGRRKK